MKTLLVIFCSRVGGSLPARSMSRAWLDAWLVGETEAALAAQPWDVLPCTLSNWTLLFRQFRVFRAPSKIKTEGAGGKARVQLLVDGSMVWNLFPASSTQPRAQGDPVRGRSGACPAPHLSKDLSCSSLC